MHLYWLYYKYIFIYSCYINCINFAPFAYLKPHRKIPSLGMLPRFRIQDHETMLASPGTPRLLLTAVRNATVVDIADRRVSIGIDTATLIGIGKQATRTTAQIGRVLGTIAFSKCLL